MSDVVDILIAAKAEIEKQGWRQGARYTPGAREHEHGEPRVRRPGCCAYDAIMDARDTLGGAERDLGIKAQDLLQRALPLLGDRSRQVHVIHWNDEIGRTVDEVNALYDRAIGMARRQEGAP